MNTKILSADWIERHIPHKGSMCLLDSVQSWDEQTIVCRALSHRHATHPLRDADGLGITVGIEYAAQAMAIHGALLDRDVAEARVGYLTSTRDVSWQIQRLSDVQGELQVRAERLSVNGANVMYQFSLAGDGRQLLSGRATVVLDAGA